MQSYSLTFCDIYMILPINLLPEECRQVWELARAHADKVHQTNAAHPVGEEVVPDRDTKWDYNTLRSALAIDQFTTGFLACLCKSTLIPMNYKKLQEIVQNRKICLSS